MDVCLINKMLSSKIKQQINQEHHRHGEDLSFLTDRDFVQDIWSQFTNEEKVVIEYFLLYKGTDFLTYREMEQTHFEIPTAAFRIGLTKLRRKGIIFTLRRLWGEIAYVIPREVLSAFRQNLVPSDDHWIAQESVPSYSSYHMCRGILQALNYVRHCPIQLTKKGTIPKKDLRILSEYLGFHHDLLGNFKSLAVQSVYENHQAIALDILSQLNLLEQVDDMVHASNVELWLEIEPKEQVKQLAKMIEQYLDMDQKVAFLYDLMLHLSGTEIFSLRDILYSMGKFAPDILDAKELIFKPLSQLGLIHFFEKGDNLIWKWGTETRLEGCQFYVQPNFEILAPMIAPLSLIWKICCFAKLASNGDMWMFRISRETLQMAIEKGESSETIVGFLQENSAVPVPNNVTSSLLQWQRESQRIRFYDMRVMEITNLELANQFEKVAAISQFFVKRLGEHFFAVNPEDWDKLVEELEKRGYGTGKIERLGSNQSDQPRAFKVFKPVEHKMEYKVESVFPELEDSVPGLRQLPRMWTANFQPYHGSTKRDVIQKAIQLGVSLKVQWKGDTFEVTPYSLENRDGYWVLNGRNSISDSNDYDIEEIQKIQVIVP